MVPGSLFKVRLGRRSAFTLVELMVVCAIMAVIAMLVIPELTDSRQASQSAAAQKLQTDLTNTFNQWVALGGEFYASVPNVHHTTTKAPLIIPHEVQLILNHLTGPPGAVTTFSLLTADDGAIENVPNASNIRINLEGNYVDDPNNGYGEIYNSQFEVQFVPQSNSMNNGTWTVTPVTPLPPN